MPDVTPAPDSEIRAELDRMNELLSSSRAVQLAEIRQLQLAAGQTFLDVFRTHLEGSEFALGGSGPTLTEGGLACELLFFIVMAGASHPKVIFEHKTTLSGRGLVALIRVDGQELAEYYRGSAADGETLNEAVKQCAGGVLAQVLRLMRAKLTEYLE